MIARQAFLRVATRSLRAFIIAYVSAAVILMFLERWLIYPIPPRANPVSIPKIVASTANEDVWIEGDGGVRLHGWYLSHPKPRATVLFFHGNGEDISNCGPEMARWRDVLAVNVLVIDYRGYGQSEGKPSEKWLVSDGIKAANWAAERAQVLPSDLVLWGRSIGGGVAAGVAESIDPRAMIMECTFDSLANVAAEHVRWIPVRWLMSNQYRSYQRLANYQGDFIQWHGDRDDIVPLTAAQRLFDAIPSKRKSFILARGRGHNDDSPMEFQAAVHGLLNKSDALEEGEK